MAKFNVGDKVRILDVDAIDCGANRWVNGDVREVLTISDSGSPRLSRYVGDTHGLIVHEREFHAIERISPLSKKRRIEALEKDVARQETELEELRAKIEAFEQKAKSVDWLSDNMRKAVKETSDAISEAMRITPPSNNQQRAQIIKYAKFFVEQTVKNAKSGVRNREGNYAYQHRMTDVHFVVKADEREVTAVAKGRDGDVVEKAIAKCAPDDVFNADIGKAIAAGRLFNLDVERFINAPKPDEVVVGHIVNPGGHPVKAVRPTHRELDGMKFVNPNGGFTVNDESETWYPLTWAKILDDTEAQYE